MKEELESRQDPTFSVVIPTYNRKGALLTTIQSVLSQTCDDFEIIVVDDGSTDGTELAMGKIVDPRIRYIRQINGGGSKARNTGIDNARGKYIAFLDSDDVFLPHHLEQSRSTLSEGSIICTYTQVIVERGDGIQFLKPPRAIRASEHMSDYLLRDRGFIQTSTLVVPRELAASVRYDETLSGGQDTDFAIRLAHAGATFRMLDKPGAIWNDEFNPKRISSKANPHERIAWLSRLRPVITRKAYWADLGWFTAKNLARAGKTHIAIAYYIRALILGCFKPKLAIVVLLQIILSPIAYRNMSDKLARMGLKP